MNKLLLILMIIVISLTGCSGNNMAQESLEQGSLALKKGDYSLAKASFELSINNGLKKDRDKVEDLILIIDNYFKAKEAFLEGDIFKAKKYIETIPKAYKEYDIGNEIDLLKGKIRDYEDLKDSLEDHLDSLEGLIEEENIIMAFKTIEIIKEMKLDSQEEARFLDLIKSYNDLVIETENRKKIIVKSDGSTYLDLEPNEKLYYVVDLDMELSEEDMFRYYEDRNKIPFYIIDLESGEEYIFDPSGSLED